MKNKNLLLVFLLLPFFLTAQKTVAPKSNVFSAYGGFKFQFTNMSDINDQLEDLNAQDVSYGTFHLNGGIQANIPNTPMSFGFEASFIDNSATCEEAEAADEVDDSTPRTIIRGYGFKVKQSAAVFKRNGFTISPSLGIGFQRMNARLRGEILSTDETGRPLVADFNSRSFSKNYYTEIGLSFEQAVQGCPKSNTFYYGGSITYRNEIKHTQDTSNAFIDLSDTNFNLPTIDFFVRVDLF